MSQPTNLLIWTALARLVVLLGWGGWEAKQTKPQRALSPWGVVPLEILPRTLLSSMPGILNRLLKYDLWLGGNALLFCICGCVSRQGRRSFKEQHEACTYSTYSDSSDKLSSCCASPPPIAKVSSCRTTSMAPAPSAGGGARLGVSLPLELVRQARNARTNAWTQVRKTGPRAHTSTSFLFASCEGSKIRAISIVTVLMTPRRAVI
ncbi:hypothetical protein DFH27DRAFT_38776 [Peziza echinospora]|nr:hypothetical protein DFH27DRAFT_38776 [Peziza echinospora]